MKKKYKVEVIQRGHIILEADDEEDAMEIVDMGGVSDEIEWNMDFVQAIGADAIGKE